jgi:methionine-S-sulfoxide reductase
MSYNGFWFRVISIALVVFAGVTFSMYNESSGEVKNMESGKNSGYLEATFAGGCFWCMQPPFDSLTGVVETVVGYSGGKEENPTYEQVWQGRTGHAEAIRVVYDPEKIGYGTLLETFWINIDPTQEDGQFADRGRHYRTAIFYHDDSQKEEALLSKKKLEESGKFKKPVVTSVEKFVSFYRAEEYHQKYYEKKPIHYGNYKRGSGREGFIKRTWGE